MTQAEALGLTLVVEAAVGATLGRWLARPRWQVALTFVAASLCTHPLVWQANERLIGTLAFPARAAVLETAVAVLEGAMAHLALRIGWGRGLAAGAAANASSFATGILLWWLAR